jgi:hypothetical protein
LQSEKASQGHAHPRTLIYVEATRVKIAIGNSEILPAAIYKSAFRTWADADIAKLLSFRNECISSGDLNAEHPFWSSAFKSFR